MASKNNAMQKLEHKQFSTAKHFACKADPAWEEEKELGNRALAAGEFERASEHYCAAANIAMGPFENGVMEEFFAVLEAAPQGSPAWRISQVQELCSRIFSSLLLQFSDPEPPFYRPGPVELPPPLKAAKEQLGEEATVRFPNLPAAICWGNNAQALLKLGEAEEALESAQLATKYAPEYVKGHHRVWRALQELGRKKEAAKKKQEIEDFEVAVRMYPTVELALLAAGWVDWAEQSMIYGPTRQHALLRKIAAELPGGGNVRVRGSIVPFQGGQALLVCLDWPCNLPSASAGLGLDPWVSADGYELCMCDPANDKMIDLKGEPSAKSIAYAPVLLGNCIRGIQKGSALTVSHVTAGQGLTKMIPSIEACFLKAEVGLSSVAVVPASHTYADLKETETDTDAIAMMETLLQTRLRDF